ncbi:hypothetical protein AB9J70_11880 [Elizabethkingia anophelis]|uniref:hypothetical protein n=1 Tax=Elizabethkingia anophelis TaxID=1117645 RepID=UPI00355815F8
MISENLSLFLLVAVLSVIGCVILFRTYLYITEKYFLNQFTWLLQKTIFRTYRVFKFTAISILLAYFCIGIYSIVLTPHWYYGLFILGCLIYLVFKIRKSKKEGKLNFREDFIFQRYSTKVSFYNNQSEEYRRKSFESIIDKIKRTEVNVVSNTAYKNFLHENFLLKIDKLLTFEYFDNRLFNSISDHYITTLFYRKFIKNVLEIISRIDKETDNLSRLNNDYQIISEILLNIRLIRFDDNQGLHYDISLIDLEIDKHLNYNNENFSLEKSLMVINQSLENLTLAFENNYSISSEKSDNILQAISEVKIVLENKKNFSIIKLTKEAGTISEIIDSLLGFFRRKPNLKLSKNNELDIRNFVIKRFRNYSNRQPTSAKQEYFEREFFIENREDFCKSFSEIIKKSDIQKLEIAKIICEEFPDIGEIKTVQNWL